MSPPIFFFLQILPLRQRHTAIGAVVIGIVWGALVYSPSAHACAACACGDPTLTVMGMGKPSAGRLRLSIDQALTSENALEPKLESTSAGFPRANELGVAKTNRARARTSLAVSAVVAPRLTLSAEASWVVARRLSSDQHSMWTAGLSDATVRGRFLVFQDRSFVPRHLISLTGGYRLPSPFQVTEEGDNTPVHIDDQPSLGAHLFEAGVLYSAFPTGVLRPFSAFVAARGFAATPGFGAVLPGAGFAVTATGQFQPIPALAIQAGVDTRSALATIDARSLGEEAPLVLTPAGHLAMAHVGVVVSPVTDLLLRLLVRVPLVDTRGPIVTEGPHLLLGATWDL